MARTCVVFLMVLTLGACASQERQVAQTPGMAEADSDGMVCVNQRVTGSRQPRQICHTSEQWAQMRAEGREATTLIQRYPAGADPDPG